MAIDYDCVGFCVLCHKGLMEEKVITGKDGKPAVKVVFTGDRTEMQVRLDDNSLMRVAICKKCKKGYTDKDNKALMQSVVKGWEKEIERSPHWTEEKGNNYMKKYGKLKIKERIQ